MKKFNAIVKEVVRTALRVWSRPVCVLCPVGLHELVLLRYVVAIPADVHGNVLGIHGV